MTAESAMKELSSLTQPSLDVLSSIDRHAAATPNHVAVIFEEKQLTFSQLVESSKQLGQHFWYMGLRPGCRVCLWSLNRPEYYIIYLAVLRCGGALFPINSDLASEEIRYIISRTKPYLAVIDQAIALNFNELEIDRLFAASRLVVSVDQLFEDVALKDVFSADFEFPVRQPDDIALVIHTSGTTGRAKGVIATDRMEVLSAKSLHEVWSMTSSDISVCALPLSYTFGLFTASYNPLCAGATVVLLEKFNPVRALQAIERYRATMMVGVPTMFAMMATHVQETRIEYDTSSMRFFAASGAPVLDKTKKDFKELLGHELLDYYALSECTPIFSFDLRKRDATDGSSGRLVDGASICIVDEKGNAVSKGEVGLLSIKSERLTIGYLEDSEKTKDAIRNGWFATGDLAREGKDGAFFIVGRVRDQIISGGHKIAPIEVEDALLRHPAVANVAVFGEPDDIYGEVVVAALVLKPSFEANDVAIKQFCGRHLAQYKIPKKIKFQSELPMSAAGKVLKRELLIPK
jgi:long-chain acyl-CoA synthetase